MGKAAAKARSGVLRASLRRLLGQLQAALFEAGAALLCRAGLDDGTYSRAPAAALPRSVSAPPAFTRSASSCSYTSMDEEMPPSPPDSGRHPPPPSPEPSLADQGPALVVFSGGEAAACAASCLRRGAAFRDLSAPVQPRPLLPRPPARAEQHPAQPHDPACTHHTCALNCAAARAGTAFNSVAGQLRNFTTRVTHVLPVSDDGGSTAEIVRVLGGPAVGDIRSRCLRLADSVGAEVSK